MFTTPLNTKTVTVKMKRIDLCNLMIACTVIDLCNLMLACTVLDCHSDERTTKWAKLRDLLKENLDDFDSKQEF